MSDDFQKLATATGVRFSPPNGFVPCVAQPNNAFTCQRAYRSPSGDLELRYRIDPIEPLITQLGSARTGLSKQSDHDSNDLYQLGFATLAFNLSGGNPGPTKKFLTDDAQALFGADWAARCLLRLAARQLSSDYDSALMYCFHKDAVADVYLIGMFRADDFQDGSSACRLFDESPDLKFA